MLNDSGVVVVMCNIMQCCVTLHGDASCGYVTWHIDVTFL